MSFLAPLMLLGLIGVGVPIWIHLRGRRRAKVVRFAAIDFLLGSNRRLARRLRLRELVLLLVRVLACLVLALALAKPLASCRAAGKLVQRGPQAVAIVIDDSFATAAVVGDETLFARAKARARATLGELGPEADVVVLFTAEGASPPPELSRDHLRLDSLIGDARPKLRPGDSIAALRRAWALLGASPQQQKVIYLISPLQATGFSAGEPPWPAGHGPKLVIDDVTDGKAVQNLAVTAVRAEKEPSLGGRGVRVVAELANYGPTAVTDVAVTLRVAGKAVARGLVSMGPGEGTKKIFSVPLPGDARAADATVEIDDPILGLDNQRYLRVSLRHEVKVLVIDGDPRTVRHDDETWYLETALRPGDRADSALALSTITADDITAVRLDDFDVAFLCNAKALAPPEVSALRGWIERGGGLFISVGDNVDADAYAASMLPLLPQPLASARTVAPVGATAAEMDDLAERIAGKLETGHPIFAPFGPRGLQSLRAARFHRLFLLGPQAGGDGRRVLARYEGGAPALVEARAGKGRILLLTSSIDRDWTDLPIHQAYLPLVQQSARYLAREASHDQPSDVVLGRGRELPVAPEDARLEVTAPSGRRTTYPADKLRGRQTVGYSETSEPGHYHVAAAAGTDSLRPRPNADFVVNVDPRGSDLRQVDRANLPQSGAAAVAEAEGSPVKRVELWHALAAALLFLLLVEGSAAAVFRA
jgi:hypothetical protein